MLWLVALSSCDDGIGQPLRAVPLTSAGATGAPSGSSGTSSGQAVSGGTAATLGGQEGDVGGFSGQGGQAAAGVAGSSGSQNPAACDTVSTWNSQDEQGENAMLIGLNSVRSSSNACGNKGVNTPALTLQPELQCAARLHVLDMIARGYFDKITPDGVTPEQRIHATGYVFASAGESLWSGTQNDVMQQIFSNSGDCSNTGNPQFTSAGVGHTGNYWVVDFTAP